MKKTILFTVVFCTLLSACAYKPIIDTAGKSSANFNEDQAKEITNNVQHCKTIAKENTTFVGNIPRLEPHKGNMEHKLAEVVNIDAHYISCKATTTDGMGPEGRNEGISAYATVLLEKIK